MNEYNIFNVIMGANKKTVIEEFGKPDLNLLSLLIYRKPVGTLAILIDNDEVAAFALYDNDNNLLHQIGIEILNCSEFENPDINITLEQMNEKFGKPHFDVGSGIPRYGYFTQNDIILMPNGISGVKSLLNN